MVNSTQNLSLNGLGSLTYTVPSAGTYAFDGKINLPTLGQGESANSSVVVTITQNAVNKYTGSAGAEGFYLSLPCAASDSIVITLASSAAVDQGLNKIKTTLSIY